MDRAELWIPWNYCVQMPTVISSVPTDEGFVIGSDGRACGPDGQVQSDDVRKIFAVDFPGVRLAYGIFGIWDLDNEPSFHLPYIKDLVFAGLLDHLDDIVDPDPRRRCTVSGVFRAPDECLTGRAHVLGKLFQFVKRVHPEG